MKEIEAINILGNLLCIYYSFKKDFEDNPKVVETFEALEVIYNMLTKKNN